MLVFDGQHDTTEVLNQASSLQWGGVVDVEVHPVPRGLAVSTFAPNPSRRGARLTIEIPSPVRVRMRIYDTSGRLVATPVNRVYPSGRHPLEWGGTTESGAQAAAGVYFADVLVGPHRTARRLVVIR